MFKLYPQKKRPSSANWQKTNRLYRKQTANKVCKLLISKELCVCVCVFTQISLTVKHLPTILIKIRYLSISEIIGYLIS